MKSTRVLCIAALLISVPAHSDETADCDRLAGNPNDPWHQGVGVDYWELDPGQAIPACERALEAHPGHPRLHYQLGRAFLHGEDYPRALAQLTAAADQGYAAAFSYLGWFHEQGRELPLDLGKAAEFYQRARDAGQLSAAANLIKLANPGNYLERALVQRMQGCGSAQTEEQKALFLEQNQGKRVEISATVYWMAADTKEFFGTDGDPGRFTFSAASPEILAKIEENGQYLFDCRYAGFCADASADEGALRFDDCYISSFLAHRH